MRKCGMYIGPVIWVLAVVFVLTACASSPLGKGVQTGEVNKLFIDSAMDEIVRMYCVDGRVYDTCKPRIGKEAYDAARSAYVKAELAQRAYADSLILWDRVKTAAADQKVQVALQDTKTQFNNVASIVCSFKTQSTFLKDACASVGK